MTEQEKRVAVQRYDMPRLLESELSYVDLPSAFCELIDNAIDETPPNQTTEITLTLDTRDHRITAENRNTTGMTPGKLDDFVQWGQEHTDPSLLKEHGQGGKLAVLYMLSKDSGSLTITSAPQGSRDVYQMELPNWWQKQTHNEQFPISNWTTDTPNKTGFTRFEMSGTKDGIIPSRLNELADRLGFVYGPLIKDSRVSIRLRRISKSGKMSDDYDVLPVTVPLDEKTVEAKRGLGVEGGKVKMDIFYGMIDPTERERSAKHRQTVYGASKTFEPPGEMVRIYFGGKLLDEQPLTQYGITRKKMSLYNFAAIVSLQGFVSKTILKSGLSKSDPMTPKIFEAIKRTITPYISEVLAESDQKSITESDRKKASEATDKLALVLLNMFGQDANRIRLELNLPTDIYPERHQAKERNTDPHHSPIKSLPGIRDTQLRPKELKIGRTTTPFPEVRIVNFGQNYPVASLRRDDEQNKLVVALNYDSPDVRTALETRGAPGLAQILRISAWALYHQKWISVSADDAATYNNGVQSDLAEFMSKARDMKVI